MNIPCINRVNSCLPCNDPPIFNLSAESGDRNRWLGVWYDLTIPGINEWFQSKGCLAWCYSDVSQLEADICAIRQAVHCPNQPPPPPPPPPPGDGNVGCTGPTCNPDGGTWVDDFFYSQERSCSVTCPDGGTYTHTVAAGRATSLSSQEHANALADSICWAEMQTLALCFTGTPSAACKDSYFEYQFQAQGGVPPVYFTVDPVELPLGFTLTPEGLLSGTPNTPGAYPMTIVATDSFPQQASRTFTFYVSDITSDTELDSGEVGVAYSDTIEADFNPPNASWQITSGDLPDGLTLNASTGVISGTPTANGIFNFTATLVIP